MVYIIREHIIEEEDKQIGDCWMLMSDGLAIPEAITIFSLWD